MMMRELDEIKANIQQLLEKRSELIILRENEKIDLVGKLDLTNLFSRLAFLADSTLSDVKRVLKSETDITESINSLNEELLLAVTSLNQLKKTYLGKLDLIEKSSGKKRMFLRGNKRVRVPEKNYKKYVRFYNATLEMDKMIDSITSILNEDVKLSFNVAKRDVKSLTEEEKIKYYSSLAALVMSDKVTNPVSLNLHTDVLVDKSNEETLKLCYQGYREAKRLLAKRDKKTRVKMAIKNKFTALKNSVSSLFGKKEERGVNMALRKSVVAASLSLGVLSSVASAFNGEISQKKVTTPVRTETVSSFAEVPKMNKFNVYENDAILENDNLAVKVSRNVITPDVSRSQIRVTNNTNSIFKVNNNDLSLLTKMGETVYRGAVLTKEETEPEVPLDERVEENAYEIVAVVPTVTVEENEESEETNEFINTSTDQNVVVDSNLTVVQAQPVTATSTLMATDNTSATLIDAQDGDIQVESVTPVSGEFESDEIVPGFHLTFNNTTYDFTEEEIKYLYYVVLHECNGTYQDALVVTSIVINRIEDSRYPNDLVSVLSAEGQFVVWEDVLKAVEKFGPDYEMKEPIYNALYDCLYRGIRNNDYVEFKASWTSDYSTTGEYKVQIAENGNKCHNLAVSLDRTTEEPEEVEETIESDKPTLEIEQQTEGKVKVLQINL